MPSPQVKTKARGNLKVWLGFVILLGGYGLYCWPWFPPWKLPSGHYPPQFTLGRDTTYFTDPLDEEGFPDYEEALNLQMAQGIDPEQNAVALLQRALGPTQAGSAVPPRFFQWLKIEPPPVEGGYFVSYAAWIKQKNAEREREKKDPLPATFAEATTKTPWREKDHPHVLEWLKLNERPLAVVVAASNRKQFFHPMVNPRKGDLQGGLERTPIPSIAMLVQMCDALICRSMWRAGQGKFNEALQDLQVCHRLAHLVKPTFAVELALALKIETAVIEAGLILLGQADFSREMLESWRKEWMGLPPLSSAAEVLDRGDRFVYLQMAIFINQFGSDHLAEIFGGDEGGNAEASGEWSNLNFDSVLSTINQGYDRLVAVACIADRRERETALEQVETELKESRYRVYSLGHQIKIRILPRSAQGKVLGEMMGRLLVHLASHPFKKVPELADRTEETNRLFAIALSFAIHRKAKGVYPAQLSDLQPTLSSSVLEDLYSGKPHVYRRTADGYVLYSVGPNGKDEEGRGHDGEPRGDDLKVIAPVRHVEKN